MFFLKKKVLILPKQTKLNKHAIKLKSNKQPFFKPIYSLGIIKLQTLKIYIKTYLKTEFIWPFKFFVGALILFNKKLDDNF